MSRTDAPAIWIVSTGTEILQGKYPDTNAQHLSRRLLEMGLPVLRHVAAPDNPVELESVLTAASQQCDLVITTGGLGPTLDDLNRQIIAGIWDLPLEEDQDSLARMMGRFAKRGHTTMPPGNESQALIPRGAVVLANDWGTAPGFVIEPRENGPRAVMAALPGPPREMRPVFEERLKPELERIYAQWIRPLRTLTIHTAGMPESRANDLIADLFGADERVNVALLASLWRVEVRLTLDGGDDASNDALADQWRTRIMERLGPEFVFGENGTTLEGAVGALLRERGETLALAESCTGGLIAGRVTAAPGSSEYFREGFVTYANEAKTTRLGVDATLIETHGAVSAEVAAAMAEGARRASGADWALSITGVAGPGGGTDEKPIGTVHMALAGPERATVGLKHCFLGDRDDMRAQSITAALALLRRGLLDLTPERSTFLHS